MPVVKQIDFKGIFERAAGHPAEPVTRTVVIVTKSDHTRTDFDQHRTLNGKIKPGGFAQTPAKRREQFFV